MDYQTIADPRLSARADDVADSTVAMSVYSTLAMYGAAGVSAVTRRMADLGFVARADRVERALIALCERGLVSRSVDGSFAPAGPPGWAVVTRDRDDPTGWSGWVAGRPGKGLAGAILLAQLIELRAKGQC